MAKKHVIHDQTNILPRKRLLVVFSGLATALLTTYIDQNSIGVALPTIGSDLNSASTIVWAGTSSLIANTAFQPLYGRVSDIFGRKVVLIICLCILALGDLLCGFAKTGPQLYAFRGISGLANGGIMATVMMIVSDVVTLEDRGKYQGVLGACVGLGNTIGPFLAAGFTRNVTWRATFWFIAPFAVCIAALLFFLLPRSKMPKESAMQKLRKVDYSGILLSCAGTIILLVPISGIRTQFAASSPMAIAMITIGAVLLLLFLLNEWRLARLPMFPLRLFENKALAAMLAQNFLIGVVFYSLLYYLPIYYQSARQMGLISSAALILPLVIAQSLASIASGQYISRTGRYGEVIWIGYACWTIGAGLHLLFTKSIPTVAIVFVLAVEGCGVGFVFQPTLVAAQAHSKKEDRAVVISARNFIRAFGGSVGLAIASAIFSNTLFRSLRTDIPADVIEKIKASVFDMPDISVLNTTLQNEVLDAYVSAAHSVFYLWFAAIAICLLLMVFIQDKGLQRKEEPRASDSELLQANVVPEKIMEEGRQPLK